MRRLYSFSGFSALLVLDFVRSALSASKIISLASTLNEYRVSAVTSFDWVKTPAYPWEVWVRSINMSPSILSSTGTVWAPSSGSNEDIGVVISCRSVTLSDTPACLKRPDLQHRNNYRRGPSKLRMDVLEIYLLVFWIDRQGCLAFSVWKGL
jgi:hypothetical protein